MKRIYKGKTKLRILVDTKCNLEGFTQARLCYRKPCGTRGFFKAGVKDEEEGVIFYDVRSASDFDQSGWWAVWPEVFFDDGTSCAGKSARVYVYECGS